MCTLREIREKKLFFSDNIPVGPWGNGEKATGSWKQRDEMMLLSQILNRSHQTWFKRCTGKGLQKASLSFKVQCSKCSDAEQQKNDIFHCFFSTPILSAFWYSVRLTSVSWAEDLTINMKHLDHTRPTYSAISKAHWFKGHEQWPKKHIYLPDKSVWLKKWHFIFSELQTDWSLPLLLNVFFILNL